MLAAYTPLLLLFPQELQEPRPRYTGEGVAVTTAADASSRLHCPMRLVCISRRSCNGRGPHQSLADRGAVPPHELPRAVQALPDSTQERHFFFFPA